MNYRLRDIGNNIYEFDDVTAVRLTKKALFEADNLYLELPHFFTHKEFRSAEVLNDSGERIFYGLVDAQSSGYSPEGVIHKIWARGQEMLMMDNEAIPQSYANPTVEFIFHQHASGRGMTGYRGANGTLTGEFRVEVGDSEWDCIVRFCRALYGYYPRIDGTIVDFSAPAETEPLRFSNTSQNPDKIPFVRAYFRTNRKKVITDVLTRSVGSEIFDFPISANYATGRGIIRRRVMRYQNLSTSNKVYRAHAYMDKSRAGSRSIHLFLDGMQIFPLRTSAEFSDTGMGEFSGYAVAKVRYLKDAFFERTELELWPKEDIL